MRVKNDGKDLTHTRGGCMSLRLHKYK